MRRLAETATKPVDGDRCTSQTRYSSMSPSSVSVSWSEEVRRFADTGEVSAQLYQKLILFIGRRALSRWRTYLPGFQWESLYGQLPWRLIEEELDLRIPNLREMPDAADDRPDDDDVNDPIDQ